MHINQEKSPGFLLLKEILLLTTLSVGAVVMSLFHSIELKFIISLLTVLILINYFFVITSRAAEKSQGPLRAHGPGRLCFRIIHLEGV